jgi:hypothetical protein
MKAGGAAFILCGLVLVMAGVSVSRLQFVPEKPYLVENVETSQIRVVGTLEYPNYYEYYPWAFDIIIGKDSVVVNGYEFTEFVNENHIWYYPDNYLYNNNFVIKGIDNHDNTWYFLLQDSEGNNYNMKLKYVNDMITVELYQVIGRSFVWGYGVTASKGGGFVMWFGPWETSMVLASGTVENWSFKDISNLNPYKYYYNYTIVWTGSDEWNNTVVGHTYITVVSMETKSPVTPISAPSRLPLMLYITGGLFVVIGAFVTTKPIEV